MSVVLMCRWRFVPFVMTAEIDPDSTRQLSRIDINIPSARNDLIGGTRVGDRKVAVQIPKLLIPRRIPQIPSAGESFHPKITSSVVKGLKEMNGSAYEKS